MATRMRLIASAAATVAVVACLTALVTGCGLKYKDWEHSLFQFVPSDVIQTGTTTVVGAEVSPMGADGAEPAYRVRPQPAHGHPRLRRRHGDS